jgi:hypothetical protein
MSTRWLEERLAAYRDVVRDGRSLAELAALEVPNDSISRLRHLGFLVVRPDAVDAGDAPSLIAALAADHGIVPVAMRVFWMRPHLFDALYRFKLGAFAQNVWLHHELLDLAPAAAFLLAGDPGDAESLSERLNILKGSTNAAADTVGLRERFARSSSFHAVVHAAEDVGALLYESTLVFPWQTLRRALAGESASIRTSVQRALLEWSAPEHQSVFDAVARTKRRIVAAYDLRTGGNAAELWRLTDAAVADVAAAPSFESARARFATFARAERPLLAEMIAGCEAPLATAIGIGASEGPVERRWTWLDERLAPLRLLYATWVLSGHEPYHADDGSAIIDFLAAHDVPLSPRHTGLVRAAMRADLARDARWGSTALYRGDESE